MGAPASDLKIVKSQGRFWPHESGYLAMVVVDDTPVAADLALLRPLQPGKYFFFVKGTSPSERITLRISCGGGQSPEACPKDKDESGLWSEPLPLEVQKAADVVTLSFKINGKAPDRSHYQFQALYVTSREGVAVGPSDHVVARSSAVKPDPSPPLKGNLIPNGSFEVGIGQGWEVTGPSSGRDYSIRDLWDKTQGSHGSACVALPAGATLLSRVIRVRPNRSHTLSVRAKAGTSPSSLTLLVLKGAEKPKKQTFSVGAAWQEIRLGPILSDSPEAEIQIHLAAGERSVWIDELHLEEGDATEYRAKEPIEIGLVCDAPAHLFLEDEKVAMQLLARNESDRATSTRISYEVFDYLNRRVKTGVLNVEIPSKATAKADVDLSTRRRGIFRVIVWADDRGATEEEVTYSVVPRPRVAGADPTSLIGVHANASDFQYEALKKLGIKWTRILSPEAWFRWNLVEPERGKYVWYDAKIQKTAAQGFQILGTIGSAEWPKWATQQEKPDLDAWEEFVFRIVDHYKPWTKYWEVWNEPVHEFKADVYAEILRRAIRAIRKADPAAKVVGLGGSFNVDWCVDVIRHLGGRPSDHFDYASTHVYPDRADPLNPLKDTQAVGFVEKIIRPFGMELWNTEAGAWCLGFHQGANSSFRSPPGPAIWPHTDGWRFYRGGDYESSRVARNFMHSVGNGFTKYFYYDSRFSPSQNAGASHCTIFGVGDTIRAKGVAYAIQAYFLDHAKGLGNISPQKEMFAYLFDRAGTPLLGVFMSDLTDMTKRRSMKLDLDRAKWKAFDLMGNELSISDSTVVFGRQPVILEGCNGLTVQDLRAAVQNARGAAVADTTPPELSIADGPRGTIRERSVRLRWIALDETSIPWDPSSRNSILYSFRLTGREAEWGAWTTQVYEDHADLPPGRYRFEIKSKDASGNVSEVLGREFEVRPR